GFLTQSGRKICRQGGRGEMLNRLLWPRPAGHDETPVSSKLSFDTFLLKEKYEYHREGIV
ncbi:MAG: hypothetical protein K2P26_08500, partial [Oscillospiraceae bacterium]|nr:hypothetical protein [Oscillospiraceae bacterium]